MPSPALCKTASNLLNEVLAILKDTNRASERRQVVNGKSEDVPDNIESYEELDETERDAVDKRIFRQVLSDKPEDVEKEIREVQALVQMAVALKDHPEEKFAQLLKGTG